MCRGNLNLARQEFDQVLLLPEDQGGLGLKEVTSESDY